MSGQQRTQRASADDSPPLLDVRADALFLDFDGTLVEIAEQPHEVRLEPDFRDFLRRIASLTSGATAVLTGRMISDVERVLDGAIAPIAGIHGAEIRLQPGDLLREAGASAAMAALLAELRGDSDARLPVRVEEKGSSVALHYRHAPEIEAQTREFARMLADKHGFATMNGKMVVEILGETITKGDALRQFMAHAPFTGRRPIVLGDDVTDEHAFMAATEFGGFGVLVGPLRETAASFRLDEVRDVRAWLEASAAAA